MEDIDSNQSKTVSEEFEREKGDRNEKTGDDKEKTMDDRWDFINISKGSRK